MFHLQIKTFKLQNDAFISCFIKGGAAVSAAAAGGARGGADEAEGREQTEGGEPQQS